MDSHFTLRNRNEVIAFEKLLSDFLTDANGFTAQHISLVEAYDKLQGHVNGPRIFAALLDIQINEALLSCDIVQVGNAWNKLSREERNVGSILDSKDNFFDKMKILQHSTSSVSRYRALWDKIFGLYILVLSPNEYDKFFASDSRKKSFKQIMSKINDFPCTLIQEIDQVVTDFDNKFRTAELHGTGTLRKTVLSMEPFHANDQILFLDFWNAMNRAIISIKDMISYMPKF